MSSSRFPALVAAAALVLASCSGSDSVQSSTDSQPSTTEAAPTTAPPATEPAATEPPATEPPATDPPATEPPGTDVPGTEAPSEHPDIELTDGIGPYAVGVQTITITDTSGGDRDLTVDVWFPLAPDAAAGLPAHQYTLLPGTYYESPTAVSATPDLIATDGPFPLVIYSHGSGGLRYIHSNYTEAIASHGYIVAAADHTGNTAVDQLLGAEADPAQNALNRPTDVTAVIDAMLNPESLETVGFVANVDPGRIAVTGHSAGGFTAYAVAAGYDNELGEYVADERVGAIVTLAPATQGLSDERLASITIPALVMAGTADGITPIDPNVTRPWDLSASNPSRRVDLVDVEHYAFTDVCAYLTFLPTLDNVPEPVTELVVDRAEQACGPDDMPTTRAQAITNTFATRFLDEVFRGGTPIDPLDVDEQTDLAYLVTP